MTIRPLAAADRAAVAFTFRRLGEQSRHQRYLGARKTLSARELEHLVAIDHWHRETLIAFSPRPRAPIGIAEYVRLHDFDTAEIALSVVDAWQRRGVGSALLAALRSRAMAAGIRRATATTLWDNRGARALAQRLGRCRIVDGYENVLELVVDLV
jgi:acetyltransferase